MSADIKIDKAARNPACSLFPRNTQHCNTQPGMLSHEISEALLNIWVGWVGFGLVVANDGLVVALAFGRSPFPTADSQSVHRRFGLSTPGKRL